MKLDRCPLVSVALCAVLLPPAANSSQVLEQCSDAIATMIFILLVVYCTSLGTAFEIKSIFCSISDSCDCDFKPDIKGKVCVWDMNSCLLGRRLALASLVTYSVGLTASSDETKGFLSI